MFGTGFLPGLVASLAGLGSAAKVAVATATVALTVTVAGATAVVLPSEDGPSAATINEGVIDQAAAVANLTTAATSGETGVQAGGEAVVATPTTSASATAGAGGTAEAVASLPTPSLPTPSLPIPGAALPDLSALAQVPTQVLSCLTPVLNLVTALPRPSPEQIRQIGPTIVDCISGIVQGLPLPFGLNACISEILGFIGVVTSQLPTGIPTGGLNVAACIPTGLPVPAGFSVGSPFTGGGFPFNAGGGFRFRG